MFSRNARTLSLYPCYFKQVNFDFLLMRRFIHGDEEYVKRARAVNNVDESNVYEKLALNVTPLVSVPYEEQLQRKKWYIQKSLKKIGNYLHNSTTANQHLLEQIQKCDGECCPIEDTKPSPQLYKYRNKDEVNINVGIDGNQKTVGLFIGKGKKQNILCVPIDNLAVAKDQHKKAAWHYQQFIESHPLPACSVFHDGGHWRDMRIRSNDAGHLMLRVHFHPQNASKRAIEHAKEDLKDYFMSFGKEIGLTSLFFQECRVMRQPAAMSPVHLLYGEPYITEQLFDMKFQISPESFFQINTRACEVLYKTIEEITDLSKNTVILDICCGTGSIGIYLSKKVKTVVGIEVMQESVDDAKQNALINGITNIEFHCRSAEVALKYINYKKFYEGEDVVAVINPSRFGLGKSILKSLRKCTPIRKIIYVTCNPSGGAFTKFASIIFPEGHMGMPGEPFLPTKAVPVDMFPHTYHSELVMLYER